MHPFRDSSPKPQPSRRALMQRVGAVASAALLPSAPPARADPPYHTLKAGTLRIGTYFVNPPFEFISGGKRVGFEVDLMAAIARRLSLHADFVDTQWEVILHEMADDRYDCIVGAITITPDRQRLLAWSAPYLTTTLSLIVDRRRSPENMALADLKDRTVAVQAATTDYDVALKMQRDGRIGGIKVYPFAKIGDAITDLLAGRVDAVMKVYPVAAWFVRRMPGLRILAQVPNAPQPLGIGFNRSNPGLVAAVDQALAGIQQDQTYRTLSQRWGVT